MEGRLSPPPSLETGQIPRYYLQVRDNGPEETSEGSPEGSPEESPEGSPEEVPGETPEGSPEETPEEEWASRLSRLLRESNDRGSPGVHWASL